MNCRALVQLRMKCERRLIFVAGGDDVSAYLRKNFYAAFNALDMRCTD